MRPSSNNIRNVYRRVFSIKSVKVTKIIKGTKKYFRRFSKYFTLFRYSDNIHLPTLSMDSTSLMESHSHPDSIHHR